MIVQADARQLPYPDASFDFIFCSPPWDDLNVMFEARPEMERVLSKRGRMAFVLPHLEDDTLGTLWLNNREWTERQSLSCPRPREVRGPKYFSMSEDFVARVLTLHAPRNARVLDPFCGVGTVPRVAARMGFPSAGCDIDPEVF